jgi:hypothetical protein
MNEKSLKMKAANFQLFSMLMWEKIGVRDTTQLPVFLRGTEIQVNKYNSTIYTLMKMKLTATCGSLFEDIVTCTTWSRRYLVTCRP